MAESVTETLLSSLSEFVADRMGLYFPRERWRDLERGIVSAAREFGFKDAESCIAWLTASSLSRKQIEILASYLTVGETYFFREKKSFEILEEHILPELIRSHWGTDRRLRVWSAGCATGEEPYSIAILLAKMLPDLEEWNITLLATDIHPRSLQKASAGVYNQWSFRDCPPWVKETYFESVRDGHLEILPHIKRLVTFSYLNLAEDVYPSLLNNTNAMDIVFCRNVLMYFASEQTKRTVQNFWRCLVEHGWLIVSPSEASHVLYSEFATVNFPCAIFYQKDSQRPQRAEASLYRQVEEQQVSPPPSLEPAGEPEPAETFVQEFGEVIPSQVEERTRVEPQPPSREAVRTLYSQGRYEEAVEKLLTLLSHGQDDARAMALLARVYANQGKLTEAVAWCEKAIAADKLNAAYYYLLATILLEQDLLEEARLSLKRTLYLDPNFVLAHFALGNLALKLGKFRESEKHFDNALSLLSVYRQEEALSESEGITAGRLMEVISVCKDQLAGVRRKLPGATVIF